MYSVLWWNNLKGRNNLDDLGVDGNMFWILNIGWEVLNWINLVHDRDKRETLVNTVMTLEIPHTLLETSSRAGPLLASLIHNGTKLVTGDIA